MTTFFIFLSLVNFFFAPYQKDRAVYAYTAEKLSTSWFDCSICTTEENLLDFPRKHTVKRPVSVEMLTVLPDAYRQDA